MNLNFVATVINTGLLLTQVIKISRDAFLNIFTISTFDLI